MKRRRLIGSLFLTISSTAPQFVLSNSSPNEESSPDSSSLSHLDPGEIFLILSPIFVVAVLLVVLVGFKIRNKQYNLDTDMEVVPVEESKHETVSQRPTVEKKKKGGEYAEFVDIEHATEEMELMHTERGDGVVQSDDSGVKESIS